MSGGSGSARQEALAFGQMLDRLADEAEADCLAVQREFVLTAAEAITVGNPRYGGPGVPVDTGFTRNSSLLSLDGPAAADIGERPKDGASSGLDTSGAQAVGAMALVAAQMPLGGTAYWSNSSQAAPALEYEGHSRQAPAGFVRPVLTHVQAMAEDAVATVTGSGRRSGGRQSTQGAA